MPFHLSIEVDGEHALDVALQRAADTVSDCSKYWPQVADVFYEIEREQFSTEGSRGGEPWAPLSAAYLRQRQGSEWPSLRKNWAETQPILIRSGDLYRSLTKRGAESGIYEATATSLTLGSSLPYALAHQRGVQAGHLPARPEIHFKVTDAQKFRKAFKDQVKKEVARAGWSQTELEDFEGVRSSFGTNMVEFEPDEFVTVEALNNLGF